MKLPRWLVPAVFLIFAGCSTDYIDVPVSYQKQPLKIAKCKPVVQYQGNSFKTSGVDIPIPHVGGTTKVGEVSLTPQTLNTLYREVAILDALRLQYCDARLTAAQISLAAFQAANDRMLQQEEKIAALALSAAQGEAVAQQTLNTVTNGPAPAPANPLTRKVDNVAVAAAQGNAAQSPSSGAAPPAAAPSSSPSAVTQALPPAVAAFVKNVPKEKLLKTARTKVPRRTTSAATTH